MAYSCYVRHEGRDLVEVQPTVTIRFDHLTAVTRNRMRRVFQDNYCPYGWSSKPHAVLTAMQGHYEVFSTLLAPPLMNHPDFDKEMFKARALLLGYEFKIREYTNPRIYRHGYGYGNLMLKNLTQYSSDIMQRKMNQMEQLTLNTLLPVARSLIDHTKLKPIMEALDNRQPYTFIGANMR